MQIRRLWRILTASLFLAALFPAQPAEACAPFCSQVRVAGQVLADDSGVWRVRGVQFFLPQFGINSRTFRDVEYASAIADGTLTYWLDKSSGYLHANMLRIFVEMPYRLSDGSLFTPTSNAVLHDIAERAAQRGMRLGISLHNSSDWVMSPDRAAWIDGMLASFIARGELGRIAYLNADNEINNHCANNGVDCFDATGSHNALAYLDGAMSWTAAFRSVVKARAPQMLVTVGISTEQIDADGVRPIFNFFRRDSSGRALVELVDFLSPHNYSGQAGPIIDDLRIGAGYASVVLLEEFGFPTDPVVRSPLWTEGPPVCRLAPSAPECVNTAPYFVLRSLEAVATKSYAGGVAWMLADMEEKNITDACTNPIAPFDLWTGVFAIGGSYCDGGTYSRAPGQPKATAFLICWVYSGDINRCDDPARPLYKLRMPLVAR
jgi:hypothetical protein